MLDEYEAKERGCCFTGHRPEKLDMSEAVICNALEREIRCAIVDGFRTFISGMARGVYIWAAEIVIRLCDEGFSIQLIAASQYKGFECRWSAEWKRRYSFIISSADNVNYISSEYSRGCFQHRNIWMVDRCARVIAVFNGKKGGTKNTIDYAARNGVPVVIIS